jgi:hypothetical protein
MSADTTHRNGSPRVHPDLTPLPSRTRPKIQTGEPGSSGRTVNSAGAESSPTVRNRVLDKTDVVYAWVKGFFIPPLWLVDEPPGWAALTAYAHNSARMQNASPLVRGLSSAWLYTVALPAVVRARFVEWVLTRPGRALLFLGVAELFLRTTPAGLWLGDLIRAWFHILAVVFLP